MTYIGIKALRQAAMAFNRATPEELGAKLRQARTANLAALRDAAREGASRGYILPQDAELIAGAITAEIERRWAEAPVERSR